MKGVIKRFQFIIFFRFVKYLTENSENINAINIGIICMGSSGVDEFTASLSS